ncbi:MAG: MoxR family ATPase [Pirellulaceae bacterium]|nr:MoxR family ATPase [Pirellulaceae bacterium]
MVNSTQDFLQRLIKNVESVVLGKHDVVQMSLVALLAGEHVLLEDVPGVGKTLVAKAISKSIEGKFTRIQFTPDLLPSDILGSSIFRSTTGNFEFSSGPIFANVVLADEINRAPPRTQSALLEAMSERQASVDGITYPMPDPFIVMATQNPFEFEGTYVLPESQLDRFLVRIEIGYPARASEREVLRSHNLGEPVDQLTSVVTLSEVKSAQQTVRTVRFEDTVLDYLQEIVDVTRKSNELQIGVSTRGALSYYRACQARAVLQNRDFVTPDDVKNLAVPIIAHRIIPKGFAAGSDRQLVEATVRRMLESVRVPV